MTRRRARVDEHRLGTEDVEGELHRRLVRLRPEILSWRRAQRRQRPRLLFSVALSERRPLMRMIWIFE